MRRAIVLGAAVLLAAGCSAPAPEPAAVEEPGSLGGTVVVFAAASLTAGFDEIAADFERAHPDVDVVLSYGGSSGLAAQVVEGAPVDVFAAASPATMATVVDAGLAPYAADFASNVLEIAVPAGNRAGVTGIEDLTDPALAIALCAVEVPCGAAARQVFESLDLVPAADTLEQDVKAVLTKVQLGEVDAGLVYRTDVLAAGDTVEGIPFPEAESAVNRYPVVVLADAPNPAAAAAFVAWILSAEGQAVLAGAGFGAP